MAYLISSLLPDALGGSDAFLQFEERLGLLASTDRPILILGERGTGKELAVQRLHYRSKRWEKPLLTVLCPALNPGLLESELFGHEAGAFTGARSRRAGCFERANGGTLFLDEVADMPLPLQDKLLRVIEYGEFERVGGSAPVRVDVRVLAATNGNVPGMVREGRFRADLLDRLAFDVLHVPPLRVRGEDKLLLARHFAEGMAAELGLRSVDDKNLSGSGIPGSGEGQELCFGPGALAQLESYPWPGNIRELKNVVERSVARRRSLVLDRLDIDPFISPYDTPVAHTQEAVPKQEGIPRAEQEAKTHSDGANGHAGANSVKKGAMLRSPLPENFDLTAQVRTLEQEALRAALEQAKYRQTAAAKLLGISYHQLRALLKKHAV